LSQGAHFSKVNKLLTTTGASMFVSLQRHFLFARGGKTVSEVLRYTFPAVVARPALAENFNCGGAAKCGSVLQDPREKRNIMGTMVQQLIEQACRRVDSNMTYNGFKSTLSEFLKRSSQLKGGNYFKAKLAKASSAQGQPANDADDA